MPYPASSYPEGVDLTIIAGNQLHQVINGEANEVVSTTSGDIPSVRKALADSMMFKVPVDWVQGEVTTDPLETRLYNGQPYWAPEATLANPITLGASPVATTDWLLAPQGYRNDYNLGKYQAGILISDSLEYVIYDGKSYFATNPPYTTTATTPDADGSLFVGSYIDESQAESISEAVLSENISTYTDIVYKSSGGNSAVDNMVNGTPISVKAGETCQCENGTVFRRVSNANGGISDFESLGFVNVRDFDNDESRDLSSLITEVDAAGFENISVPPLPNSRRYTASSVYQTSKKIKIMMIGALVNITHNDDFIRLQHSGSKTIGGSFFGTGKGDTTKPLQSAIRIYPNTINCTIDNPLVEEIAGGTLAGGIVATDTVLNHQGNRVINPTITDCNVGLNLGNKAEYFDIAGGGINLCNIGLRIEGGNNVGTGIAISDNVVGVDVVAGSNDSHGSLNNCQINHNTTPFRVGDINTKQFEFNGCHIFFGTGELNGCEGVVFNGGEMGNLVIQEDGCRNCFVINVNIGAGGISPVPNHNGNASEVFYLDLIQPIAVSAKTSSRLNGLRVFADNNGTDTIATGRNQYQYPRVSQQIPYNPAYSVQQVYDTVSGNFNAEEFRMFGGFEVPVDIRLSLSNAGSWNPDECNVYLENIDTGARISELRPQTLFVSGSSNIYTYQFSGVVDKVNMGIFIENNTGGVLSTFSDQENSIRSYWLSTLR